MEHEFDSNGLYVIYVQEVGKDNDGYNVYEFLIGEDADSVWAECWNEKPCSGNSNDDMKPSDEFYDYVKELRTNVKLDVAQNNSCFSFLDVKDDIVALAYENLDEAEEYPENGRIVIHYGESLDSVEKKLAKRDLIMKFV